MRYELANQGRKNSLFDVFFRDKFYDGYVNGLVKDEWKPNVDIVENDDKFVITADLSGIEKKDINVDIKDGVLTIKGERKNEFKEENGNVCRLERSYGSFSRSFNLYDIDEEKIAANYKNGTLILDLPKAEERKAKNIQIQGAA